MGSPDFGEINLLFVIPAKAGIQLKQMDPCFRRDDLFRMSHRGNYNLNQILWRADMYRLLAVGFDIPRRENAETLVSLATSLADSSFGDKVLKSLANDLAAFKPDEIAEKEALYHNLFTTRVECPSCEGSYHQAERGPIIGDVSAFYAAFQVKAVSGHGPPDSIRMELGFMSFLCLKGAYAESRLSSEESAITLEAQKKFLCDHLGRWTPLMALRLGLVTDDSYYFILAKLLGLWIEFECRLLEVEPAKLPLTLPGASVDEKVECA